MNHPVNMDLVVGDLLFFAGAIMIRLTDGLKQYPVILGPLLVITFTTCLVRHINYYKHTKRIY